MAQLATLHPLSPDFVPPKPQQVTPRERVKILSTQGLLYATRKRDGYGGLVVTTGQKRSPVELYTRTGTNITAKFPKLVEETRALKVPKNTLTMCELFWSKNNNTRESLETIGSIARSGDAKAVAKQKEIGSARLMLFTPLIIEGKDISPLAYMKRVSHVQEWLDKIAPPHLLGMEHLSGSIPELEARVIAEKWEGLVYYDGGAGTEFRMDGNHDDPPRPDGSWKWKPLFEDDFVATGFEPGTGRNAGLAGKIYIAQVDPRTRSLVPCGEVPLHKKEHKQFFADKKLYPTVVQVEYEIRTPKGALRTSKVLRLRDDKGVGACHLPEEYHTKIG